MQTRLTGCSDFLHMTMAFKYLNKTPICIRMLGRYPHLATYQAAMKVFDTLWRKLTASKALEECGPIERKFLERVYRHAYITGLSYSDNSKRYRLYSACVRAMSIFVIYLEIWHACTNKMNLDRTISMINVIIIHILTAWKLVNMLINKDVYKNLPKSFESPFFDTSTSNRKKLVDHWANTHEKYLSFVLYMSVCTLFFWDTFPFIDDVEYNLMIEIRVPVEYNTTLRYIIAYIVVGIMFNIISYQVIMSEVIMQAYLPPLICQYDVLADCFENIFNDCAEIFKGIDRKMLIGNKLFIDIYKKRLGNLVDQHLMILKQTNDLKRILSAPMLGQLIASGMLICFVGYQTKTTMTENPAKFIMSVGYLGYNMFTLYLNCRWCEEITSQSQGIGEAAYCSGWEAGMCKYPGFKATIMTVIIRANKPMIFVAGVGEGIVQRLKYTSSNE